MHRRLGTHQVEIVRVPEAKVQPHDTLCAFWCANTAYGFRNIRLGVDVAILALRQYFRIAQG